MADADGRGRLAGAVGDGGARGCAGLTVVLELVSACGRRGIELDAVPAPAPVQRLFERTGTEPPLPRPAAGSRARR